MTNKPDIIETAKMLGLTLRRVGRQYKTLCISHNERNPSLFLSPERQTAYCFGCGFKADVIGLVMTYLNMSFLDALKYLGIQSQSKEKTAAIKEFREWERQYHREISSLLIEIERMKRNITSENDLLNDSVAKIYHFETECLRRLEILESGNDKAKFNLYKEVRKNGR